MVPINGQHRKPYLTLGALIYSFSYLYYALWAEQNVITLAAATFIGTMGMIMMDVMADTMCVERSRFEPEATRGQMQSSYYSIRFAGSLLGSLAGALVSNKDSWGWGLSFPQVALINGAIPFVLVTPWLFRLREKYKKVLHVHHEFELVMSSPVTRNDYGTMRDDRDGDRQTELLMLRLKRAEAQAGGMAMLHPSKGMPETYHSMDDLESCQHQQETIPEPVDRNEKASQKLRSIAGSPYHYQRSPKIAVRSPRRTRCQLAAVSDNIDVEDLDEEDTEPLSPLHKQCQEIWNTVQLKSVWRPMTFVYIFNLLQIPNVAWQSYLQLSLHFEPWLLGAMVVMGSFMTFAGVLAYKYFFFKTSWRKIYLWSVVLTTFFSLLQLLLIFQINRTYFHIGNIYFSLGDDVITAYISGIQFLPLCIMYMKLCPDGAEGASYSMLTTFGNIAMVCASSLGTALAGIWDVSNDAMRRDDVSGLWKLHVLTSLVALVPLAILFLLPKNEKDQEQLSKSKERSTLGGIVFLVVLCGSLAWTSATSVMTLFDCYSNMHK